MAATNEKAATVLVVDDSAFMRKLIAELVESTGAFRVVATAADGIEALQKIRTVKPDIVTLDIEMPRLNGLQTLEQIMAEMPRPVVMLSAAGSELGNAMTLRARESQGPAWSGSSTVTFGSCLPGRLVSARQGNGTWGPGAGH